LTSMTSSVTLKWKRRKILKTKLKKTKKKINLPTYLDTKNPILYVGLYIVQKTYPNIIRCRNYFLFSRFHMKWCVRELSQITWICFWPHTHPNVNNKNDYFLTTYSPQSVYIICESSLKAHKEKKR
jgi:hypothetical protein